MAVFTEIILYNKVKLYPKNVKIKNVENVYISVFKQKLQFLFCLT